MWLLSGGDKKIHAYKSDKQQICEENIEEYFIEFKDTDNSIALCFDTKSFNNYKKYVFTKILKFNNLTFFINIYFQKSVIFWR